MKLLDISSFYSESGGGVRTYHNWKMDYFKHHPEHEYVLVVSSDRNRRHQRAEGGSIYRLPGFPVSKNKAYRQICDLMGLHRIIRREQPDVIEIGSAYLDNWLAMMAARWQHTVKVGFYHADFPDSYLAPAVDGFPKAFSQRFVGFWHQYVKFAYEQLDATVVTSNYIDEKLKHIGVGNTIHIPLGVDANHFNPSKRSHSFRASLGVSPDETLMLYAGRFSTEKGIETMLQALPTIAQDRKRKIVLVGNGPIEDQVLEATGPLDNVTVFDFESDKNWLATLYASADIFLAPGPYETFGLSVLEALCSGVPVVVAASGGAFELVEMTTGGEAFEVSNPASMIASVNRLLERDTRRIGMAARESVTKHFSWVGTFDSMMSNYQILIDKKREQLYQSNARVFKAS